MAIVKGRRSRDLGNFKWAYFKNRVIHSDVRQSKTKKILGSILAIFVALMIAIIIACSVCDQWKNFGEVFKVIFTSGFDGRSSINMLFSNMAIMLVAGLAFIFAYKAGQFNIGISGQMVFGGTLATIICHVCNLAPGANQIVVLLVGMIGGAFVATIVGILKAYLNVNEVVSSIMFNWIIYFMSILLLSSLVSAGLIKATDSGDYTKALDSGILLRINGESFGPLLIISFVLTICIIVILNYTVFGKKQKVVGLSRTGALASGYNVKLNTILSLTISGALSGILGVMLYAGLSPQMPITAAAKAIPQEGFNGISVGLIAMVSPAASIPVSLFFSMIQTSVAPMQTIGIDNHIANVVFGIVVYGSAAIALFLNLKPYWWTLGIFKGKNYNKIKYEKNQSEIMLLEMANDSNELLKKYYMYSNKSTKVKSSMKITFGMKYRMWKASVEYHWVNFWYGKIRKWDDMQMATLRSLSNIQNRRSGLQFKMDVAIQNKLDWDTLLMTQRSAANIGLPSIKTYHQYKIAHDAFIKAYFLTSNELYKHYQAMFKKYAPTKAKGKKIVFDPAVVKYDSLKLEQLYMKNLRREISKVRELITRPNEVKADLDASGSVSGFWKGE